MPRRRIALLSLAIALLAAAFVPWDVTSDRVVSALTRQIRNEFGGSFALEGPTRLTLLPSPQLTLQRVRLTSEIGSIAVETGELRAELRLLPLLMARLRLQKVSLTGGHITLVAPQGSAGWRAVLDELRGRSSLGPHLASRIDRFVLTDTDVTIVDSARAPLSEFRGVGLLIRWPDPAAELRVTASAKWKGEQTTLTLSGLRPAALAEGQPNDIEASLSAKGNKIAAEGSLSWNDGPHFVGNLSAATISLAQFVRWTGIGCDVRDVERPASLSGYATIGLDKVEWSRAALDIGTNRLDGTVALHFGEHRPQIRATLAGNELDVGWLPPLLDPAGAERLDADYDLRLSASAVQIGKLRLQDAAASIQASGRAIEVSLGRAALAGGSLRGRIASMLDGEGRDIKAQAWFDRVELDKLLPDLTSIRGISGTMTAQAAIEVGGDRGIDPSRQMKGRATLTARDGEIAGTALVDPRRPIAASTAPDWRSGKARFSQAALALEFGPGAIEVIEGTMETPGAQTQLQGRVLMEGGIAALRATTKATGPTNATRPPLVVDLTGPLLRLVVSASEAGDKPANP